MAQPQSDVMVSDTVSVPNVKFPSLQKVTWNTDPLSPTKAAFYSAVLPGLGQAYNKSYWKIPIVYVAIGTGLYFYINNTQEFQRYQRAYKRRIAGFTDDEFYGDRADGRPRLSTEGLQRAQQFYNRNREMSLLITLGLYVLNIVEANVDAHLKQFNVDDNLSFEPFLQNNEFNNKWQYGLAIKLKF